MTFSRKQDGLAWTRHTGGRDAQRQRLVVNRLTVRGAELVTALILAAFFK